jgi:hypothetical protein
MPPESRMAGGARSGRDRAGTEYGCAFKSNCMSVASPISERNGTKRDGRRPVEREEQRQLFKHNHCHTLSPDTWATFWVFKRRTAHVTAVLLVSGRASRRITSGWPKRVGDNLTIRCSRMVEYGCLTIRQPHQCRDCRPKTLRSGARRRRREQAAVTRTSKMWKIGDRTLSQLRARPGRVGGLHGPSRDPISGNNSRLDIATTASVFCPFPTGNGKSNGTVRDILGCTRCFRP